MLITGVLFNLFGLGVIVLGVCGCYDPESEIFLTILAFVFGAAFLVLSYKVLHRSGSGHLGQDMSFSSDQLKANEIYQVVLSEMITDKKYIVILKTRNKELRAYLLDRIPPDIFIKYDDLSNPYRSFPEK